MTKILIIVTFTEFSYLHNEKVEEALDMVKIAIRNLKEFKTCFQEYKIKLPSYFVDKPQKSWEFQVGSYDCINDTNYDKTSKTKITNQKKKKDMMIYLLGAPCFQAL